MKPFLRNTSRAFGLVAALMVLSADAESPNGASEADVARWPLDRVLLKDRRVLTGLVRHESDNLVELVEVGRKPGQPMFLTVRWLPREQVKQIERIDEFQRLWLREKISSFRNRTKIAARRLKGIELSARSIRGIRYWHYPGPWFSVASTADESLTREAIVRLEQIFAGYRTFLQPRIRPRRPLRVVLLGTLDEYEDYQRLANLSIRNPAYFDPRRNEIVAGGELASFAERLAEIRQHHQELLKRYNAQEQELQDKLQKLSERYRAQGVDDEKIRQLRTAARKQWSEQVEQQELKIRRAERANDQLYQQQFRVLYHEAFHAYLDNYVFDPERYEVPRWLNEGWAQVFEGGLLDAGSLRLDSPNAAPLAALQADLSSGQMLPLAEVIRATPRQFLVGHNDAARQANRLYVYSWGLAHYLTFEMRLLDSPQIQEFVDAETGPASPVARFERLIGKPLDQFQQEWRQAILAL